MRFRAGDPEHPGNGSVQAKNGSRGVKRNNPSGNVLENSLHQLAPALKLLHCLLEIPGELIDLRAAVAQLCGHGVKGAHQDTQLILSLLGDLVIKVAG